MGSSSSASYPSFDPMLDGRKEIAKYNRFMDEIFMRMNIAIKAKQLDPMDLKLLPTSDKVPRSGAIYDNVQKVIFTYLLVYCTSNNNILFLYRSKLGYMACQP